jgi:hypothetical protein
MLFLRQSSNRRLTRFLHSSGNLVTWFPTKIRCSRAVRRPISFGSSVIVLKDISSSTRQGIWQMTSGTCTNLLFEMFKNFRNLRRGKYQGSCSILLFWNIRFESSGMRSRPASSRSMMRLHDRSSRCRLVEYRTLCGTFFIAMLDNLRSRRVTHDWIKASGISTVGLRERLRYTIELAF